MYQATERTRVRRLPERASYDPATVHAILDEGFVCHVGFEVDGQPYVVPTGYARAGETLYLHGSTGSRLGLRPGDPVCVTVTLLDGLVLARSAFHHSMNYRSVTVLGRTRLVTDPREKDAALRAFVEHVVPAAATRSAAATVGSWPRPRSWPCPSVRSRPRSGAATPRTTRRTIRCRCGRACCRWSSCPAARFPMPGSIRPSPCRRTSPPGIARRRGVRRGDSAPRRTRSSVRPRSYRPPPLGRLAQGPGHPPRRCRATPG